MRRRAVRQIDLSGPQLYRQGGGSLGDGPIADDELRRVLFRQPSLHAPGHCFVGKRRNYQRRVKITHQ